MECCLLFKLATKVVLVNLPDSVPPISLQSFRYQFVAPRQTELPNAAARVLFLASFSLSFFCSLVIKLKFLNFHCIRETANVITANGLVLFSSLMHGSQRKVKPQT